MATLLFFKQLGIFFLLWLAYGSCYLLRKPFGIIKSDIQESLTISDNLMGYLDFAFSLPYAFCSLFLGFIGDKFGLRRILGCALLGVGITGSVMGRIEFYYELCILLFINGSFQAICWPAVCAILASWFDKTIMSSMMAVYGSCILVGGICSSLLTVTLQARSGWRSVFAIPSLVIVIIGLMVLFFGYTKSSKIVVEDEDLLPEQKRRKPQENKSMSIRGVLCIPNVPEISVALFFVKGLRTAAMFWLPLYLTRVLHFSVADSGLIPLTFEVGGLVGSVVIIVILDKVFKVSDLFTCIIANMLCGVAFPFLLLCDKFGVIFLHIILFLTGAFSAISEIILCGSLPAKIGEEVKARSSVVSVVNGFGSLGNVVEGPIVAWISSLTGFQSFVIFCSLSCLSAMLSTLKAYFNYRNSSSHRNGGDTNNTAETGKNDCES